MARTTDLRPVTKMDAVRYIFAFILFTGFAYMAVVNWRICYANYFKRDGFTSVIPLLGGALGAFSILLVPVDGSNDWFWVPLFLDWGTVPVFFVSAIAASKSLFFGRCR